MSYRFLNVKPHDTPQRDKRRDEFSIVMSCVFLLINGIHIPWHEANVRNRLSYCQLDCQTQTSGIKETKYTNLIPEENIICKIMLYTITLL